MTATEIVAKVESLTAIKGRWGYYPCTHDVFTKLKQLNKAVTRAERTAATYRRWVRKMADSNDVRWYRPILRDENNRKYGYGDKAIRPEPAKPSSLFYTFKPNKWTGLIESDQSDLVSRIKEDYRRSRYPVVNSADVKKILLTEPEIDSFLESLK